MAKSIFVSAKQEMEVKKWLRTNWVPKYHTRQDIGEMVVEALKLEQTPTQIRDWIATQVRNGNEKLITPTKAKQLEIMTNIAKKMKKAS